MNNHSLAPAAITTVNTANDTEEPRSYIFGLSLFLKLFSSCVRCNVFYRRENTKSIKRQENLTGQSFLRRETGE